MIRLLQIVFLNDIVRGQTGTCCYNPLCAIPNAEASDPVNLTETYKDLSTKINAATCCPSGGIALIKYNDASSADYLCRCFNDGFIQQTCPYLNTDASTCSNDDDDACPDSKLGTQSINGVIACVHWSGDGIHYVPQRCPTRLICLQGMSQFDSPGWNIFGAFDGEYYTNSSLYYNGVPLYRFRDVTKDYERDIEIRLDKSDYWEVLIWRSSGSYSIYAQLPVLYGAFSNNIEWDIMSTQSYASSWGNGWSVWNGSVQDYQRTDAIYLTEGECPTTSSPSVDPTIAPTQLTTTMTTASSTQTTEGATTSTTDSSIATETTRFESNQFICNTCVWCYVFAIIVSVLNIN